MPLGGQDHDFSQRLTGAVPQPLGEPLSPDRQVPLPEGIAVVRGIPQKGLVHIVDAGGRQRAKSAVFDSPGLRLIRVTRTSTSTATPTSLRLSSSWRAVRSSYPTLYSMTTSCRSCREGAHLLREHHRRSWLPGTRSAAVNAETQMRARRQPLRRAASKSLTLRLEGPNGSHRLIGGC